MSMAKRHLEDVEERGFEDLRRAHVCDECLADEALESVVRANATSTECDYCGRPGFGEAIAAPTEEVAAAIMAGLRKAYVPALGELFWDAEEDGGAGGIRTYDARELLWDAGWPFFNEEFAHDVADAIGEDEWVSRNFARMSTGEALNLDWNAFVQTVRHERRFFFTDATGTVGPGEDESLAGYALLERIGELIVKHGAVTTLPRATRFARVRVHDPGTVLRTAKALGTPPAAAARANRMSPAGIAMLYAALDDDTALVETVSAVDADEQHITLAHFQLTEDLIVVDMTRVPPTPSLFGETALDLRDELAFLNGFTRDLSRPVKRDGREHVDYVPTQIVCEYLRHGFLDAEGKAPGGIMFESSQKSGGVSAALFIGREDCLDDSDEPVAGRAQVRLKDATSVRVDVRIVVTGSSAIPLITRS